MAKDDAFNVLTEITDYKQDEEEAARLASKAEKKKQKKELSKEEREAQRKINRENREKKKQKKDINKKRKRGELSEDEEDENEDEEKPQGEKEGESEPVRPPKPEKKKKEIEYGVWVGNLAYSTTSNAIREFFKDCGEITRLKCPKGNGAKNNNKGFAYVFFSTEEASTKAIALSEQKLDGRSLLIKDSENFERADDSKPPTEVEKKAMKKQKNPPSPTLFLGNLSFDTTKQSILDQFSWAGDIRKVRVATFEDSGKCKGFAYVDYHDVESATKAIRAPDKHTLDGRKVRVEFASPEAHMRSKPWLMRKMKKDEDTPQQTTEQPETEEPQPKRRKPAYDASNPREKRPKKTQDGGRVKPGEALSSAQRQKPTVQEFKGSKIVFD